MSFILGGLLSGLGKGMGLQALQDREDALEKLKNQRTIESEGRKESRDISAEERKEVRDIAADERMYGTKVGLLETSGKIKDQQQATKHEYDKDLTVLKGSIDERLAHVRGSIDRNNDEASIRLKQQLDNGTIDDVMVDRDGNYVKVYRDGRTERTDIQAAPSASEQKRLDELEDEWQRKADRAKRRGDPVPEKPEALRTRGGSSASPKPPLQNSAARITPNELTSMYNEAMAAGLRGDPLFKGLSAAQIKAKVDKLVRDRGIAPK